MSGSLCLYVERTKAKDVADNVYGAAACMFLQICFSFRDFLVPRTCSQWWRSIGLRHTSANDPISILTDSHALARLLELKILQQLHAVRIFTILLQTALPFPRKPFRKGTCGTFAGDGIDGDCGGGSELHLAWKGNGERTNWPLGKQIRRQELELFLSLLYDP